MERITFVNLLGVSIIAFLVPFILGFFPRLRIPSVVLELVAGIIFGPAVLGWIQPGPVVTIIAKLGVAFLLFLAGMELDLRVLKGGPLRLGGLGWLLSVAIGLAIMVPLGATGFILSPLLVATALAATSVGIVIPVLRDTGQIDTPMGRFTVAGGSVAEFGTIALLGVFFAGEKASSLVEALLLAAFAVLSVVTLWGLTKLSGWEPGRRVLSKLDDTSSQVRVRFAVVVLLLAAVIASDFGFEAILGTFLAGAVLAIVIRGDRYEETFRRKIEAVGFGFFVPVFFVTSGLTFSTKGLFTAPELMRIAIFFFALLAIRALPALLYWRKLAPREVAASGLLQATNLSFIVVATAVGIELGKMRPITGSSLVVAGLLSAVLFPAISQMLLGGANEAAEETDVRAAEFGEEQL